MVTLNFIFPLFREGWLFIANNITLFCNPKSSVGFHMRFKALDIGKNSCCCFPIIKGSSRMQDASQALPNGCVVVFHSLTLRLRKFDPPTTWNLFQRQWILHLVLRRSCWDRGCTLPLVQICTWVHLGDCHIWTCIDGQAGHHWVWIPSLNQALWVYYLIESLPHLIKWLLTGPLYIWGIFPMS